MKKSLIALAVVGSFSAPAFADPTLYGTLDGAIASISNTGQKSQMLAVSGGLAPSLIGVKAAEDLGGGLTGVAVLEYAIDGQDSSSIGGATAGTYNSVSQGSGLQARQKLLGVAGSFGTVATGYLQTTAFDFGVKFDPTAQSSVSALQNMTVGGKFLVGSNAAASRAQRALAYISPNMSGVTVAVNYSTALANTTTGATAATACAGTGAVAVTGGGIGNLGVGSSCVDTNVTATLLSATYDAGPLSLGAVYAGTSVQLSSNANTTEYALGASYDLGMAKVFGTYQASHVNATTAPASNTNKLYSLSGVIPAGPGAVALSYASAKIDTAAAGTNTDGTSYTGAYLYNLSKKSTLYAAWSHTSNGSQGTSFSVDNSALGANAGGSSNLLALGLSHKF